MHIESQDSQAILDALRAELGVSSGVCPPSNEAPPKDTGSGEVGQGCYPGDAASHSRSLEVGRPGVARQGSAGDRRRAPKKKATRLAEPSNSRSTSTSAPFTSDVLLRQTASAPLDVVPQSPRANAATEIRPPKMATSQDSPTQVNEDRDYGSFDGGGPSSLANSDALADTTDPNDRSLLPDDTGAVNFGDLDNLDRPSSQVSEDAGFDNTHGQWRAADTSQQQGNAYTPYKRPGTAPETPALPRNPFGARPNAGVPYGGTQLFGQTQFSSVMKKASPTSSRPSPHLFVNSVSPNLMETSPLKNRANVSSPTDIRSSSPNRMAEVPGTTRRRTGYLAPIEETPSVRRGAETPSRRRTTHVVPESPTRRLPRPSSYREPISHYEPIKKSQERKKEDDFLPQTASQEESSYDDATRKMNRRRLVEKMRADATQEMGRVKYVPLSSRDSEGPRTRKRRKVGGGHDVDLTERATPIPVPTDQEDIPRTMSTDEPVADSLNASAEANRAGDTGGDEEKKVTPAASNEDVENDIVPATSPVRSSPGPGPEAEADAPASEPELPHMPPEEPTTTVPAEILETSSLPPQSRKRRTYARKGGRLARRSAVITSSPTVDMTSEKKVRGTADPTPPATDPPSTDRGGGEEVRGGRSASPELHNVYSVPSSASDAVPAGEAGDRVARGNHTNTKVRDVYSVPLSGSDAPPTREAGREVQQGRKGSTELHDEYSVPLSAPAGHEASRPPSDAQSTARDQGGPSTPEKPRSSGNASDSSSELTVLSRTPTTSTKTTPGTQNSPTSSGAPVENPSVSSRSRTLRKRPMGMLGNSVTPRKLAKLAQNIRDASRPHSESTDELQHSPSASGAEHAIAQSRAGRTFRQSMALAQRSGALFEGMAFALSFSSQSKPADRTKLESMITHGGGTVLQEGFQELFETSDVVKGSHAVFNEKEALQLTESACSLGFTAVIADEHSRKTKFMQALALGLPCLAPQWITACVTREALVDWCPYLLCAGTSTVLGNAIRSRILTPYAAASAELPSVINARPRPMAGQSVLLLVDSRRARNEAKQPYIFLVQTLGARMTRVFTTRQAQKELGRATEPYDWIYIDPGTVIEGAEEPRAYVKRNYMAASGKTTPADARKAIPGHVRRSVAAWTAGVRILDDEIVIQSLILGRMLEEGE